MIESTVNQKQIVKNINKKKFKQTDRLGIIELPFSVSALYTQSIADHHVLVTLVPPRDYQLR